MNALKTVTAFGALAVLLGACSSPASQETADDLQDKPAVIYYNLDDYLTGIWIDGEEVESDPEEGAFYIMLIDMEEEKMRIYQTYDKEQKIMELIREGAPTILADIEMNDQKELIIHREYQLTVHLDDGSVSYEELGEEPYTVALTDDYRLAFSNPEEYYFIDFDTDQLILLGDSYIKLTAEGINKAYDSENQ